MKCPKTHNILSMKALESSASFPLGPQICVLQPPLRFRRLANLFPQDFRLPVFIFRK